MILNAMMVQVGMKYAASNAPLNELIRQFVDMSLPAYPQAPKGSRGFAVS
jgi:hypothetical protein